MLLLRLIDISLSFGGPPLLNGVALQVEAGERIGLVGRNGSGKSTLMKLLAGHVAPDAGSIARNGDVGIALLPQDVPEGVTGSVYDVVASGCEKHIELLREYHDLTSRISRGRSSAGLLATLEQVQHRIETSGAWQSHQRVETMIAKTDLNEHDEFRSLSTGMKRRVFLARALVSEPDVLLLDEPTNHLDIATILWLEDFLLRYEKAFMFVTHDRAFLARLSTRIVEIDRGRLLSFACDYTTYLKRRQVLLEAEEKQWHDFDKKLAKEEAWIRQGVKARRTRNEGRARALVQMRQERARRQEQEGVSRLVIREAERSGRVVVDADSVSFSWDDRKIVSAFSTTIIRGDRVGIIGPNGSGKTTLLKVLLGELKPQQGKIRLGAGIKIAYFDQLREQLDENKTLRENIADANDMIIMGDASRHVVGYLQDFLFSPERTMSPVRTLSGGERNRLLLAKLFVMSSNVLVLDEPTNDLDAETLELLEDRLLEYKGTILLVSHDREFLNNVVTSTIVLEGEGRMQEYVGGYDDWVRQRSPDGPINPGKPLVTPEKQRPKRECRQTISYKEQRELEDLPGVIELLEAEQKELYQSMSDPTFYQKTGPELVGFKARLKALEQELEQTYQRWEILDMKARDAAAAR
ncbi:MAG: ATP-binding cassette domain-containing protein [Syntrophorhabdales bacterium]